MKNLVPYLMFNGDCEEAINFYKQCLDGEVGYMGRFGESPMEVPEDQKNKIMHVEFKFAGGSFMASDNMDSAAFTEAATGSNIHLSLGFDNEDETKAVFEKLQAGGEVTMPLQAQFWGDLFGMITDKYGIKWMVSCAVPKS